MYITFISNLIFIAIEAYFIYVFLNNAYKIKVDTKNISLFILAFTITNGVLSFIWINYLGQEAFSQVIKSILLTVVCLLIIKILLNTTFLQSIISFCILGIGMTIGNSIIPLIFSFILDDTTPKAIIEDPFWFIIANSIICFIGYVFVLLASQYKSIFYSIRNNPSFSIMFLISFFLLAFNTSIYNLVKSNRLYFFLALIVMLLWVCITILNTFNNFKFQISKEDFEQQRFYNTQLDSTLTDLRRFKHDLNNHLYVLSYMLKNNNFSEADSYLDEMLVLNESFSNTAIFNVKNAGLYGILSSKLNKAKENDIKITLSVIGIVDSIPGVKITELCEIIGIFLDNAIEEAIKTPEKKIEVTILATDENIDITIKNDCECIPDINKIRNLNYSTKGTERGNGLKIVNDIISKYDSILNIMRYDASEKAFIQTLSIVKETV